MNQLFSHWLEVTEKATICNKRHRNNKSPIDGCVVCTVRRVMSVGVGGPMSSQATASVQKKATHTRSLLHTAHTDTQKHTYRAGPGNKGGQ